MSLSEFLEGISKPLNSNNKNFWSFEKTQANVLHRQSYSYLESYVGSLLEHV